LQLDISKHASVIYHAIELMLKEKLCISVTFLLSAQFVRCKHLRLLMVSSAQQDQHGKGFFVCTLYTLRVKMDTTVVVTCCHNSCWRCENQTACSDALPSLHSKRVTPLLITPADTCRLLFDSLPTASSYRQH